jgi:subtilase family serine protease
VSVLIPAAFAAVPDRIQSVRPGTSFVTLHGSVNARVSTAVDRGLVAEAMRVECIRLELGPTSQQQADLAQFLERQRDPSSSDYQGWLTPEQYADRFGVSENDLAQVSAWLVSRGFEIEQTARGRNWISFHGTAAQIRAAFRTEIHQYEAEGELHFANATTALIPEEFAGVVTAIRGLDDFRPHPQHNQPVAANLDTAADPQFNASNGAHYLAPDDLAAIYDITPLYTAGYNGTGQKLAIVGQTDIALSDMRGFRSQFGLAAADPQLVLFGADPGVSPGDQIEADLDLEWAGAVARNAKIYYVYSVNVIGSLQYAVDQNVAPVISMSYGECESGGSTGFRAVAQQANAQGITWLNASGDSGAAGCDWDAAVATHGRSVIFPADIPEVTAVGGTELNESGAAGWNKTNSTTWASAGGYLPEKAWNDSSSASGLAASGGGASAMFTKPWWQSGPGVPSDGARDVPDISLSASAVHDGYLIYANGSLMAVGGTSASTPAFAGIITLINQYVVAKGLQPKPGLGNINPALYNMAQTTTGVIHDITLGDNIVPCTAAATGCTSGTFGYKAGPGYDMVTGLGSVDAYYLAAKWNNSTALGTTLTLSASPASISHTGSTQLTAVVSPVTGNNPPTGSVTFTAGGVPLGSSALTAAGSTSTAKMTVQGTSLPAASNTVTANYAPVGNFAASSATTAVSVIASSVATTMTLTATPSSIAASASVQLTATVTAASGSTAPAGSVSFAAGNNSLGSATLTSSGTSSTATLTVKGSSLASGSNSINATYIATTGFGASSGTANVTVILLPATTTSVVAAPSSLASSGATQLTATVKAASGTIAPTGAVTFSLGNTNLGSVSLSAAGAALLSVKGSALAIGSNNIVVTYPGSANFAASSATVAVTVTAPPAVATVTTLTTSNPSVSIAGNTQLTAMVTSTATAAASGTITFTAGTRALGTVPLGSSGNLAGVTLLVSGANLALGSNSVTAAYSGGAGFSPSTSSPVTVTVSSGPVATTATALANPSSFPQTGTTQILVTVRAASGTSAPSGAVAFASGKTSLGSATLIPSGSSATATFTLKGSSLIVGANTISAAYPGATGFTASTAALTVTITAPTATTTTVAASASALSKTAQTQLTATVRATSGSTSPTGTVTFTAANVVLGTAQLAPASSVTASTAAITLKGISLAAGLNTITATYQATGNFSGSTGSASVTLTVAVAAPVILTLSSKP